MSIRPSNREPGPVLTTGLRRLLAVVLILFGLLCVNSAYLASVTVAETLRGEVLQNHFYLAMFLVHLGLGVVLALAALVFGAMHLRRALGRPNRYAVRAGLGLYASAVLLTVTGIALVRFDFFAIDDPRIRAWVYWVHVTAPLAVIWLFVLHRLAGPRLRWQRGFHWTTAALALTTVALAAHLVLGGGQPAAARSFAPALAQVPLGGALQQDRLMGDETCGECHRDIAAQHARSMHRLSSFNNPAYRRSVEDSRAALMARDGNVHAARLCAVCHDPVPLFSGRFDDPAYDPDTDPGGRAGITCLSCHAITAIGSPRGNGDYTLVDPPRYPFELSDNPLLRAVGHQLIRAKPALHRQTLLKPLHRSAEFCSACHKVHLPFELNRYRWLRGQNHYDSFLLSGVSGHRVDSFYYPPQAKRGCSDCHMPPTPSDDPAARDLAGDGRASVHDHLFAAANTAVPQMLGHPAEENAQRFETLRRAARVDIFGIKEDGSIDGRLHAPLRPGLPALAPGRRYLLEVVVRTTGMGHELTQGTTDSNELWVDVTVRDGRRVIGRSGALGDDGDVDPWAYFLNAYLLDRDGSRIERRNVQDIFVALYNHQIPPGSAAVVHYALEVPRDATGAIRVEAAVRYRKFDTRFYRHVQGDSFVRNDLPIATLAADEIVLPLAGEAPVVAKASAIPEWERWNDYGIGLFREGSKGESRQAEAAFARVESLGRADGALNRARVLYREGRLEEAAAALGRAASADPPAAPWTIAWYSALVERDLGNLDAAVAALEGLAATRFDEARARGFDFGRDYQLLNELGRTLYERARQERGEARRAARTALLERARDRLRQALAVDPENAASHYALGLVFADLGEPALAAEHRNLHERFRTDDNAVERAVTRHRSRNPAANHAAEAVVINDLNRPDGLAVGQRGAAPADGALAGR